MQPTRTFITISALLAVTIGLVVWKGHRSAEKLFIKSLNEQGKQFQHAFEFALDASETTALKVPAIIANDPVIRRLLINAHNTIKNSGHHSAQTNAIRKELLKYIQPLWSGLSREFDIRQLHFHLAPNGDSFLRVHQAEKFADNLSTIRHTVSFAHRTMKPSRGLEIGRASLGVRGVYPILEQHTVTGSMRSIAAIDVGSSTETTLKHFHTHFAADIAILLNHRQLKKIVWEDVYQGYVERGIVGKYVIEEASQEDLLNKLSQVPTLLSSQGTDKVLINAHHYALTRFLLYDFLATRNKGRAAIGMVTIFADITEEVSDLEQNLLHNSLNALGIFLVLELFLFILWGISHRGLQQLVDSRTSDLQQTKGSLEQANKQLEQLASSDALTGIANRRAFNRALNREWARAIRDNNPISLIMCDIDYFKQYNDIYGHLEGDECLHHVAEALQQSIVRKTDLLARYGGEEFCALLPNTNYEKAAALANKMKMQICKLHLPHTGSSTADHVTASFGIATLTPLPDSNQMSLIKAADEALYNAKAEGRNRVK